MKKSALQVARAAYQPKLPKALQGPVVAVEGACSPTRMECPSLRSRLRPSLALP